jgi:hypothetical protein
VPLDAVVLYLRSSAPDIPTWLSPSLEREETPSACHDDGIAPQDIESDFRRFDITDSGAKQTPEVEISVREPVVDEDGAVATEALPLISDVPVLWPGGGGFHVHLPLAAGDHVLLVFSDLATGVWRSSGQQSDPGDLRRHHLSYCFAIPCVRPDSSPIPRVDGSDAIVVAPSGKTVTVRQDRRVVGLRRARREGRSELPGRKGHLLHVGRVVPQDGGDALKTLASSLVFEPVGSVTLKAD